MEEEYSQTPLSVKLAKVENIYLDSSSALVRYLGSVTTVNEDYTVIGHSSCCTG